MRLVNAEQFRGKHEVAEVNGKLSSVILYGDIVNAPTVDAVEVVRCRDCKYSRPKGKLYECPFFDEIRADEYCSSGERKDNVFARI